MPATKTIAIIGGGIAGLSAAFFLQGRTSHDGKYKYQCTIYEASGRLGGNAYTAYLGDELYTGPFAEMGVNDFNIDRYNNLVGVFKQLAGEGFPVEHGPVVDTTTWYTPQFDGVRSIEYTDVDLHGHGNGPASNVHAKIADDWQRFVAIAPEVMGDGPLADLTVREFVAAQDFSPEFTHYNLFARIRGLFFCSSANVGDLPIRAVMSYFHLCQGIGQAGASATGVRPNTRHFFTHGASSWIKQLTNAIEHRGTEIVIGARVKVRKGDGDGWKVSRLNGASGKESKCDAVVLAVPADQIPRVISQSMPSDITEALSDVEYSRALSVVHEDERVMPRNRSHWGTYNILIHPEELLMPHTYSITFLCSKHQGRDIAEPPFVTIGPYAPIDARKVLTMRNMDAYSGQAQVPAMAEFRHQVVSSASMKAQRRISSYQGVDDLYFSGGWANGAGLHEEIIALSKEVSLRIRGFFEEDLGESPRLDDIRYVPKHIRDNFIEKADYQMVPAGYWL